MRLRHSFQIAAPLERVWPTLTNATHIAQCLPGAKIAGVRRDGTHHGTIRLKLGPATTTYRGGLRVQEADAATRTAVLLVSGPPRRGQRPATATITSCAREHNEGTLVDVDADLGGPTSLAALGLVAVAQRASRPLLEEFADRMATIANARVGSGAPRATSSTGSRPVRRPSPRAVLAETARGSSGPAPARRTPFKDPALSHRLRELRRTAERVAARVAPRSSLRRWLGVGRVTAPAAIKASAGICPYCGAGAGELCRTRSGSLARSAHASRPRSATP